MNRGLGTIDALLEQNRISHNQIALCLPTGGMVNMPSIRDGLTERFGGRAPRLENGETLISEGAAWIANDGLQLGLAKPIELLQSDGSYVPVVPLPFTLPIENQTIPAARGIYHCVDPRPGRASFSFARPDRPQPRDARSDRQTYGTFHLDVDEQAAPLMERLEMNVAIDHDYVAHVDLKSTMRKGHISAQIYDLEFTLQFPMASAEPQRIGDNSDSDTNRRSSPQSQEAGQVQLHSNVSHQHLWNMVPGDLVEKYRPSWFDDRVRQYSEWQKKERDYYKDCPHCSRTRYSFRVNGCDNAYCLWKLVQDRQHQASLLRAAMPDALDGSSV